MIRTRTRSTGLFALVLLLGIALTTFGCRGGESDDGDDGNVDAGTDVDAMVVVATCDEENTIQEVQDENLAEGTPVAVCGVVVMSTDESSANTGSPRIIQYTVVYASDNPQMLPETQSSNVYNICDMATTPIPATANGHTKTDTK